MVAKKKNPADRFPKKPVFDAKASEDSVQDYLKGTDVVEGEDDQGYQYYKQGRQIRDIVLEHIKKLSDLSLKEMKEGYWKIKPVKVGDGIAMQETYFEDLREAYINGVDHLFDLIGPTLEEDKKKTLKKFQEKHEKDLDALYKKYHEDSADPDDWIDEKLREKRKLFSQINFHLDKIDYFTGDSDEFMDE